MPFIRRNISKLITTVLMGALSVFFLIPFVWMVSSAFKFEKDVMRFPIEWIPKSINVVYNFKAVWMGKVPFLHIYFNSIKVAVIVTFITLLVSTMAAYSFTKLKFRGRNLVFTALLAFMIIPDQATLIPRFMLIRWMGLYDTHVALIFMSMFSIYFTFLLRQFMVGISDEYIEAAKIDGAGHFRTFASIIVLLCHGVCDRGHHQIHLVVERLSEPAHLFADEGPVYHPARHDLVPGRLHDQRRHHDDGLAFRDRAAVDRIHHFAKTGHQRDRLGRGQGLTLIAYAVSKSQKSDRYTSKLCTCEPRPVIILGLQG